MIPRIKALTNADIPVMGHIGLTPQSINRMGGYKIQGKDNKEAIEIKQDAYQLQEAGVFSIVLEGVYEGLAAEITQSIKVPTIGIGAGIKCDGQILVLNDMLGLGNTTPKFVKQYTNLANETKKAINQFIEEVREETFPNLDHSYTIKTQQVKSKKNRNK